MGLNETDSPSPIKLNESRSVSASLPLDSHTLPAGLTCGSGRATGMNLLISSAEDSPVKTSVSLVSEKASVASGLASSGKSSGSPTRLSRRGDSLKMSQGCLALGGGGETWPRSLRDFGNAGLWSATQCWTASISESRNVAAVCSLSAVLQSQVSNKYFLTPRAAVGILRRAAKRGRTLPVALEAALHGLVSTHPGEAEKTT